MEAETRLWEVWRVNNDLRKFYEDLKQERFRKQLRFGEQLGHRPCLLPAPLKQKSA
jgi:hypothetical protein